MIRWAARHPAIPLALAGIIVCLGAASVWRTPVAYLFGSQKHPLQVYFWAPGEPGREALLERLARPLEDRAATDPGVAHTQSWVSASGARLEVELKPGENDWEAAGRLREMAAAVAAAGPPGSRAKVYRARSYGERPGLIVQLTGVEAGEVEKELLPVLRRLQGVQEATLFPPRSEELRLTPVRPGPGAAGEVRESLRRSLAAGVLGRAEEGPVVSPPAPRSLAGLLDTPVRAGSAPGRLGDVARAAWWRPPAAYSLRVNGREGLFLFVRDDPTAPRRTALAEARRYVEGWARARAGAGCTVVRDTWREVLGALYQLALAAFAGLLLTVAALASALGRARTTALIAGAIPVSLALALVILAAAGVGLDVVVLSGLALGAGLLAQAGVAMGESFAATPGSGVERASVAAARVSRPLLLGALAVGAVLLPLLLGLVEELDLFRPAAYPVIACAAAALLVAFTVLPGAAAALGPAPRLRRPGLLARSVKAAVRDPLVVGLGLLALAVGILFLFGRVLKAGDSLSGGDLRWAEIEFTQPAGASRETFDEACKDLEVKLARVPGVEMVIAELDLEEGKAWLSLRLSERRSTGKARDRVLGDVHWAMRYETRFRWKFGGATEELFDSFWESEDAKYSVLGVRVRGEDLEAVEDSAERVLAVPGRQYQERQWTRRVELEPRAPGDDLARRFGGLEAQRPIEVSLDGEAVAVTVEEPGQPQGGRPPPLAEWLETPRGTGGVPAQHATANLVKERRWPARKDGAFERKLSLQVPGRGMQSEKKIMANRAALYESLRALPLPAGVTLSMDDLAVRKKAPPWLVPMLVALFALYLVLGVGFESGLAPLRVMACAVPSVAGGVLGAWVLQVRVNEAAILAFLLTVGLSAGSAALLEDRFLSLRRSGVSRPRAATRAAMERGPAVLLMTAVSLLSILPLWFAGIGNLCKPLVAILGGGILLGAPVLFLLLPALETAGHRRPARERIAWRGEGSDVVALRSLSKTYRGGVRALSGVCASLEPGLVGLLGPNGAGKTTLLRCFVGTLRADRGDVWVDGVPRREDPAGFRSLVGYLPQAQEAPARLESLKWLTTWAAEMGIQNPPAAAEGALATVGVADLAGRRLGELSGGQRRRVCIARALLGNPRILVVDEPTTGLDPEARVVVRNQLAQLAADRLVILSTHIAEDVAVTCRRVLVLAGGRLLFDGETEELLEMARGKVRSRLIGDEQLRIFQMTHRIISRVRELEGIRVRYLTLDPQRDKGEAVDPTLEEAYLALVEQV